MWTEGDLIIKVNILAFLAISSKNSDIHIEFNMNFL